ncbi:hypothetical protein VE02_10299 [Pseudogymnoascus sp. 03VT05]|nr:hypothetical protein VE02_10299 [Pseudogymnoascus sp. 03VT05]
MKPEQTKTATAPRCHDVYLVDGKHGKQQQHGGEEEYDGDNSDSSFVANGNNTVDDVKHNEGEESTDANSRLKGGFTGATEI